MPRKLKEVAFKHVATTLGESAYTNGMKSHYHGVHTGWCVVLGVVLPLRQYRPRAAQPPPPAVHSPFPNHPPRSHG